MIQSRDARAVDHGHLQAVLADERPFTARSVVASALLGTRPPRLPVRRLVLAGQLFGIGEGATRTALWRMVSDGELVAEDGWYRIAGRLIDRMERIDESQAGHRRRWDGPWELAVVAADRRDAVERAELRNAAAALHLRSLREGVWTRPDNLDPGRLPAAAAVVDAQCVRFTGATAPEGLAGRLFDLEAWQHRADLLAAAMDEVGEPGHDLGPGDLAAGFVLSAAVVRHLQADPLLPDQLLPADWPGDRLRRRYEHYDRAYKERLAVWLRAEA